MHAFDVIAVLMIIGAAAAFGVGASALARTDDLVAAYWLVVGVVSVRGAVQIARSGVRG